MAPARGRQLRLVLLSAAASAALLAPAAQAATPRFHTFRPAGLYLSFSLPSDWGEDSPDRGWKFQYNAPGFVASLHVDTAPSRSTFAAFAGALVTTERKLARAVDPSSSVAATATTVGAAPAVKIVARYHGAGAYGPAAVRTFVYGFEHGGVDYVFEYSTTAKWLEREQGVFDRSMRSLRFTNAA